MGGKKTAFRTIDYIQPMQPNMISVAQQAIFWEIQHYGTRFLDLIGEQVQDLRKRVAITKVSTWISSSQTNDFSEKLW
ncbi:hypothetical protein MiSe_51410 [Microseira wollei NIES-4236]|uniref:Uncharacterized protein n=2 Tax=Microseira wollei TaxID=467598 RepID=A0AAV3XLD3_9CYAN|nr:hypothetical protein MiSe_51410 [Microseira wollei NIES-4236]